MTPYEKALAEIVHTQISMVNWHYRINLSLAVDLLAVSRDKITGADRYRVDVRTGDVVVRIYYYHEPEMAGSKPHVEAYTANNETVTMYVVNATYLPKYMTKTIISLAGRIHSQGGTYEVFPNGSMLAVASTGPIGDFLADHLANIFTDELGNLIQITL